MHLGLADHRGHRTFFQCGVHVIVSIQALALDRKEQFAHLYASRIDGVSASDLLGGGGRSGNEFRNL